MRTVIGLVDITVKEIFESVMRAVGISFRESRLVLHVSRGPYSTEIKVNDPAYLFLPVGTYILELDNVEWNSPSGKKVAFEFLHLTFETKPDKISILGGKVGLQDIEVGTTIDIAESREMEVCKSAENGLTVLYQLMKIARSLHAKIGDVFPPALRELFSKVFSARERNENEEKKEKEGEKQGEEEKGTA